MSAKEKKRLFGNLRYVEYKKFSMCSNSLHNSASLFTLNLLASVSADDRPSLVPSPSGKQPENIKILGVALDNQRKFDAYITNISTTASRQINSVERLAKFLNERSHVLVYKSFISSNFNYCSVIWMFCGWKNVTKRGKNERFGLSWWTITHLIWVP